MISTKQAIAPGSRVIIRDEEWLIHRIDRTSNDIRIFGVVGLSPLVEGKDARFIEDIEAQNGEIKVVDPKKTKASIDKSPYYRETRLFLESHLRSSSANDSKIHIGHRGALDVLPFQLEPTTQALSLPRQRILIADAVGLGKTIECGILLSELIKRGKGKRILVVTVKSMLTQFQKELWSRFSLPLTRLDSTGLQSVRRKIPTNHNPFHYYDKSIISIDTLKQDGEFRTHLENAYWDIIVIDEAHNVAERGNGGASSLRSRAAKLLAKQSDSLILLSATPHDGKRESFASLMNMLNPTAIKDPKNYGPDDIDGLFIRRFKKDVKEQISGNFPERVVHTPRTSASAQEEAAYLQLSALKFHSIDKKKSGAKILFRTLLEKALFSSPAACGSTILERIKRLTKRGTPEDLADVTGLQSLLDTINDIHPTAFSKYQNLLQLLSKGPKSINWSPRDQSDRLVIFTERIDTLKFLQSHLPRDLKLKDKQVAILHGGMSDIEQQEMVEAFGSADSKVRLLIASDVAAEGINLHHHSHRLIHFDIPWSLITFQQRNGRVDRYGQSEQPEIYYLLTDSSNEQIRGDQRILELLIEKDTEVQNNIGDPSEFTGLHSSEEEEEAVGLAIQSNLAPEQALEDNFGSDSSIDDWFNDLIGGTVTDDASTDISAPVTEQSPSLYSDDYQWAKDALETLKTQSKNKLTPEFEDSTQTITINIPAELRRRLKKLPREIISNDTDLLSLTSDRDSINKEIVRCRAEEGLWPRKHLLWEQHPVMNWAQDKLLSRFGRHQASCVHLNHLQPGERIVVGTGIIPNRKGQTLIQRWYGVQFINGKLKDTLDLESLISHTKLNEQQANPDKEIDLAAVQSLFPETVECLQIHLSEARDNFRKDTQPKIDAQLAKLRAFLDSRTHQLELDLSAKIKPGSKNKHDYLLRRKDQEQRDIQQKHDDYKAWVEDTMNTEDSPSIRLFTVLGNFNA